MSTQVDLRELIDQLDALRDDLVAAEAARADDIGRVAPRHRASAANLVHYLALRRHDIRDLQEHLSSLGLSSLGRAEAHVLESIDMVLGTLRYLAGQEGALPPTVDPDRAFAYHLIDPNADALLGPDLDGLTRIMVTLPSDAANDGRLVERLVAAGMGVARINCAHDDPDAWRAMIDHVRTAAAAHGRVVPVTMDLAGPKLRTGPLEPGPRVLRVSPERDETGVVVASAVVWLTSDEVPGDPPEDAVVLPVSSPRWLERRAVGDEVTVVDSRGARRTMVVTGVEVGGCLAELGETTYFASGLSLLAGDDAVTVGELPQLQRALVLRPGDALLLTRDLTPAPLPGPGEPARIGCTLPEAFADTRAGQQVFLDDGKIGGVVEAVTADAIVVRITHARASGTKLKAEKGINLPDTDLRLDALTDKDLEDIAFVAAHADVVNLSFVRVPADVEHLIARLAEVGGEHVGMVLKIETVSAFENLPELLLTAMRSDRVGVMIARGDLAVEAGFERLAEVQEEILWLCEAAHTPVIWATQVLDTMARTGRPSRAEVSDAASAERAECVMLNKGPYIVEAVETLADILRRMNEHQSKKRPLLRRLRAWDGSAG